MGDMSDLGRNAMALLDERAAGDPPLPRSVRGIRALLAAAITRGISLGRELKPQFVELYRQHGFAVGPEDWSSFGPHVDRTLEYLMCAAAERLPTYCHERAPAARYVAMALRGGLIKGLATYRDALIAEEQGTTRDGQRPCVLPADPEWMLEASTKLLRMLLDVLEAIGIPLPGATEFLLRARALEVVAPEIHASPESSESWEARTTWITDPDGPSYQWAVARRGRRLFLSRRLFGAPEFQAFGSFRLEDTEPLTSLLRIACRASECSG